MPDTQWRRYQVFLQEREGDPYQDVGSIHAPDPEMALLNARDVFARRPSCVGLWVVPVEGIYMGIREDLTPPSPLPLREGGGRGELGQIQPQVTSLPEKYFVFTKTKHTGTQTFASEVQAATPAEALQAAVKKQSTGGKPPLTWWVFPARLVIRTTPEDIESMFAPALDKPYRLSTGFRTVSAMREIKSGSAISSRRPKRS